MKMILPTDNFKASKKKEKKKRRKNLIQLCVRK